MPRRYRPPKRKITPDPKYGNYQITMFVNRMMSGGKKSTAVRMFYESLDMIAERENSDPMEVFERALRNVTPTVEVKPRRVGGSTYQVPVEVPPDRARSLAIRWLLSAARSRGGRSISEKLANELMEAAKGQGNAIKKREDTHRMAEANRAFSHYRW
jgi:small subunit ribosomal protein S7